MAHAHEKLPTERSGASPRWFARLGAVLALALMMILPAGLAHAESPVTFPSGTRIVDTTGILDGKEEQIQQTLSNGRGQMYVAVVGSFTNPSSNDAWAGKVGDVNSLPNNAMVLAIAADDRQVGFAYSTQIQNSVSSSKLKSISDTFKNSLQGEELSASSLERAIADTNAAFQNAVAGGSGSGSGSGDSGSSGGGIGGVAVGGVLLLGAGGVATYFVLRNRKKKQGGDKQGQFQTQVGPDGRPLDPLDAMSVEELRKRAGSLLIAADDAIKSSEQELGFAEAQYGKDSITTFAEDIEKAKGHLSESFKLQQQLDDSIPDTEEQQRTWLKDIIRRCEAVNQSLQEHKADFDKLRELESRAPEALASAQAEAAKVEASLATADQDIATLAATYADSALTQVKDNVTQARERLDFVKNAASTAQQKLDAGDTSAAAVAVRAAEESVYQANVLLEAIKKAGSDLAEERKSLETAVGRAAQDLAQAKALVASGSNPELAGPVASMESTLANVKTAYASGRIDPIALLQQIQAAQSTLDGPLGSIRDQQEQARRAAESLQQWIGTAQAQISGTQDFIRARRGGVGAEARTRLAEAERNLKEAIALQSSDPVSALAYAQQANALAQQAAQQAQQDVDGFDMGGFGGGGMFGGGGNRGGSGMGGALLGGILLGQILGGGSHSSGGGSSNDGGFFGGGGFGGFGGGGGGGFGGGFGGGDGGSF